MSECPVEIKPMANWLKEEDKDGFCRECIVGPVVQWYTEELREQGQEKVADKLLELAQSDTADYSDICKALDAVKESVALTLRERLLEFDCAAQSFNPESPPD